MGDDHDEHARLVYPENGPSCGWCSLKEQYLTAAQQRLSDMATDRRALRETCNRIRDLIRTRHDRGQTADEACREVLAILNGGE
jgi:hypothetical protein